MECSKDIVIRGRVIGGRAAPLVCVPLTGRTRAQILEEMRGVIATRPDLVEWRADFYAGIGDQADVLETCALLVRAAQGIPLLFTVRSAREGGQPIPLSDDDIAGLCAAVCETGSIGLVDFECDAPLAGLDRVRAAARASGTLLVVSHHNFRETPGDEALYAKFLEAARLGGDVVKVAVMPASPDDVLTLLRVTWRASQALDQPLISMSMGADGVLTRIAGWRFGSSVTFAGGEESSAPGQMPIEDLRRLLAFLQRAGDGSPGSAR